jgi:hypothetical protein
MEKESIKESCERLKKVFAEDPLILPLLDGRITIMEYSRIVFGMASDSFIEDI